MAAAPAASAPVASARNATPPAAMPPIKIGQESKPEIRLRASAVVAESHHVPGPQQLIGTVAHQCHETFDVAAQPGSDDRVGACPEIVRKFCRHNLGQSKHQLMTALGHPLPLMAPAVFCKHIRRHIRRWCSGRGRHGGLPSRSRRNYG